MKKCASCIISIELDERKLLDTKETVTSETIRRQRQGKNMNIYDIAKEAGVSITTVSRVINKKGYVSEKTRKKIQEKSSGMSMAAEADERLMRSRSDRH
mgnify:CR=1 FL=1